MRTSTAWANGGVDERGEGEAQSDDTARRRRGAPATILGVRAGGGAAWRGRQPSGEPREGLGARRGRGAWPTPAANASRRGTEKGDGVDGIPVISSNFQSPVCKLSFPPSSLPQTKNF